MDKNSRHLPKVKCEVFFHRGIFLVLFISIVNNSGYKNFLNRIGKVFL